MKKNKQWLFKYSIRRKKIMQRLLPENPEFSYKMDILTLFSLFIAAGIPIVTRIFIGPFREYSNIWVMWTVAGAFALFMIWTMLAGYLARRFVERPRQEGKRF